MKYFKPSVFIWLPSNQATENLKKQTICSDKSEESVNFSELPVTDFKVSLNCNVIFVKYVFVICANYPHGLLPGQILGENANYEHGNWGLFYKEAP